MPQLRTAEQWGFNPVTPPLRGASLSQIIAAGGGWNPGMGAASTAQIVGAVGGSAAPVITAAAAPAVAAALGIGASLAVPIVGAVFAGVLFGVEAILNSGCGQTCVQTSEWANQAEPLLRQNCNTYFGLAVRTKSDQKSALNVFDAVWAGLVQRCGQPGMGDAGKNCIGDRQAGACKWHATADSPWPGGPKQGECWNWFNAYRDVIANDSGVVSDASGAVTSIEALGGGGSLLPLLAIAGLVLLGATL